MSKRGKRKRRCRKKILLLISVRIFIDADGTVIISSLFGELVPLVAELGYIKTKYEGEVRRNGTDV